MSISIDKGMAPEQLKAVRNHLLNFMKCISAEERTLLQAVAGYTMLPPSRILDAFHSARQAAGRNPSGAIIEFGVYAGGALASLAYGASLTDGFQGCIMGFDTFEGHTAGSPPMKDEVDLHGVSQSDIFERKVASGESWAACSIQDVQRNIAHFCRTVGCSFQLPTLVKGDASLTSSNLREYCDSISLLRLDMDWYEPTAAALKYAAPLLAKNAILIADDYGHHSGVRLAIDQFLKTTQRAFDYTMTDYSCLRVNFLS